MTGLTLLYSVECIHYCLSVSDCCLFYYVNDENGEGVDALQYEMLVDLM